MLEQFVIYAFIWSYSLRAQYWNLGWLSAQNYIMGYSGVSNAFNIYKVIAEVDSPSDLQSSLANLLTPLSRKSICTSPKNIDETDPDGVYTHYLHFFDEHKFLEVSK